MTRQSQWGTSWIFVEGDWSFIVTQFILNNKQELKINRNTLILRSAYRARMLIKRVPLSLTILYMFIVTEKSHKISTLFLTASMCCHECHLYEYHFSNFMVEFLRSHTRIFCVMHYMCLKRCFLPISAFKSFTDSSLEWNSLKWNGAVCQSG